MSYLEGPRFCFNMASVVFGGRSGTTREVGEHVRCFISRYFLAIRSFLLIQIGTAIQFYRGGKEEIKKQLKTGNQVKMEGRAFS